MPMMMLYLDQYEGVQLGYGPHAVLHLMLSHLWAKQLL